MADWRFEFVDSTGTSQQIENEDKLASTLEDAVSSGVNETKKKKKEEKTFRSEFNGKIEKDSIRNFIVSPLNTVTGGLATPLYMSAKKMAHGQTLGAVTGDLIAGGVILALTTGIDHIRNRLQEIETKVNELGNTDNALIRAGSISKETYYTGNIFGVKKVTDRS